MLNDPTGTYVTQFVRRQPIALHCSSPHRLGPGRFMPYCISKKYSHPRSTYFDTTCSFIIMLNKGIQPVRHFTLHCLIVQLFTFRKFIALLPYLNYTCNVWYGMSFHGMIPAVCSLFQNVHPVPIAVVEDVIFIPGSQSTLPWLCTISIATECTSDSLSDALSYTMLPVVQPCLQRGDDRSTIGHEKSTSDFCKTFVIHPSIHIFQFYLSSLTCVISSSPFVTSLHCIQFISQSHIASYLHNF